MASQDKKPLLAYLNVQKDYEAQLIHVLGRVAQQTEAEIKALAGKRGIGAKVRSDQLRLTLQTIYTRQAELWKIVGSTVEEGRKLAAAAAIATNFDYEKMLLTTVMTPAERKAMLESAQMQAMKGLDAVEAKLTGLSDVPLSARVYNTAALSNGQVRNVVINALGRGASWSDLASEVRGLIRPDTPGGVSYAAKRLARTELNNAFHASAVKYGASTPFITGQKWNLSGSHPKPDACNDYADRQHYNGGDAGVFRPNDVPGKPHPNCLCFLTPVTPSREEFLNNFVKGDYDSYLGNAEPHVVTVRPKAASAPKMKRIDPKEHAVKALEPTIKMMTDGGELTREAAIRILSKMNVEAKAVFQQGRVTAELRTANVTEEQAQAAVRHVYNLTQLDKLDRDITIYIRDFDASESGYGGKTLAFTATGDSSMAVSPRVFAKDINKNGLMPAGREGDTMEYLLTHEYGHMRADATHEINSKSLSRYAQTSHDEAYAEAYAEWVVSKGKTDNKIVQELAKRFSWPKTR